MPASLQLLDLPASLHQSALPARLAADYRTRMEAVFEAHSGLYSDNEANSDLLKTALVNGLHPDPKNRVMTTCVGWETIAVVWAHVLHAERNKVALDSKHTEKLQTAQLMFYQQSGPQNPRPRGQPPRGQLYQSGRGKRRPSLQPASFPGRLNFVVRCFQCDGYGHILRDCPIFVTDQQGGGEQENSRPHAPPQGLSVHSPGLPVAQPWDHAEAGQNKQHTEENTRVETNETDKPVITYRQCVQLTLDSKTPPRLTLKIQGVDVTFRSRDSGAEVSDIQSKVLPNAPKTTKFLKTVGASGVTKFELISE